MLSCINQLLPELAVSIVQQRHDLFMLLGYERNRVPVTMPAEVAGQRVDGTGTAVHDMRNKGGVRPISCFIFQVND